MKPGDKSGPSGKMNKPVCPVCRAEVSPPVMTFRPFCSERCRIIDLGKWATGDYRIPGPKADGVAGDENKKSE